MRLIKLANGYWLLTIDGADLLNNEHEPLTFEMDLDTALYAIEGL